MQEEHEAFVQVLEENGVEVLYLDELAIEAYKALDDKSAFVEKMLEESNLDSVKLKHHLRLGDKKPHHTYSVFKLYISVISFFLWKISLG